MLGDRYLAALTTARELSVEIEREIEDAKAADHSMAEICTACGLSTPQIEYIVASVHIQRQLDDCSASHCDDTVAGKRLTP
jgi:hypothetical protein